ncbi:MAG TPA: hypothetical protein PL010_10005 [Flavobacteriales bacterium]|nr:hypothetical protein [Flavobacteriales bacterium]
MNMPASGKRQKAGSSGQPGTVTLGALLIACCLLSVAAQAQKPTPAPPETRSILLKGGTVHAGDGTVIDDAAVGFRKIGLFRRRRADGDRKTGMARE